MEWEMLISQILTQMIFLEISSKVSEVNLVMMMMIFSHHFLEIRNQTVKKETTHSGHSAVLAVLEVLEMMMMASVDLEASEEEASHHSLLNPLAEGLEEVFQPKLL